jgi:hypothetical protein
MIWLMLLAVFCGAIIFAAGFACGRLTMPDEPPTLRS